MILQALHELAEREKLLGDPDYEQKPVAYLVGIADDGRWLGIQGTHYEPEANGKKRGKPKRIAKTFPIPREPGRTSGDRSNFLVDKAEYAFGVDPDEKRPAKKLAVRHGLFRDRVRQCLAATDDPGVAALDAFLARLASGEIELELPEGTAGNDLFAFVYGTEERLLTARPAVVEYWKNERQKTATGEATRCLVTGEMAPPADKHTILKYVPGAVSSGVPLVSFNAKAFESYGLSGNENAPVSRHAAESYATALQRLLHPAFPNPRGSGTLRRQNIPLTTDTVVCHWSRQSNFGGLIGAILNLDQGNVPELYTSLRRGRIPLLVEEKERGDRFYALTLSGAQGRVVVRTWLESTVGEVADHLTEYFRDIDMVTNTPAGKGKELPPRTPLGLILESLGVMGKRDTIPPQLAGQLLDAALRGTLFPLTALQRAVLRFRAEIGRDGWLDSRRRDARAALIKAVLNRRIDKDVSSLNENERAHSTMDPQNDNPGYVLGRLMATIERLQQIALGDVNASVVDRYFSAASAAPRSVFVRLMKNARHHARKARDDRSSTKTAFWLERQLDELADRFDPKNNGFPAHLSLEEQGLFILGYHQQRRWLWLSKEEREAAAAANLEAA